MGNWSNKANNKKSDDFKFEIVTHFCNLESYQDKDGNYWTIELNEVAFNGNTALFDIRAWNSDHTKMGKGIRFGVDGMDALEKFFRS